MGRQQIACGPDIIVWYIGEQINDGRFWRTHMQHRPHLPHIGTADAEVCKQHNHRRIRGDHTGPPGKSIRKTVPRSSLETSVRLPP